MISSIKPLTEIFSFTADIGGNNDSSTAEERARAEEAERERLLALREAEKLRKEKHKKMEREREKMRQTFREKYNLRKKPEDPADELRKTQEAEMSAHIAAMNPRNPFNKRPASFASRSSALNDEEDFASKLMSGNLYGAAANVANKVQSLLPQNFSVFKKT